MRWEEHSLQAQNCNIFADVIPSREDDEGPHKRSIDCHELIAPAFAKLKPRLIITRLSSKSNVDLVIVDLVLGKGG
jgi:hypothetical protein